MRNYDRVNANLPPDIHLKHAHIVGAGLAGLATAAFLVSDGHMNPSHVHVYEQTPLVGGAMDAGGSAASGFSARGERELEPYMECLWYLFSKVPSLRRPGRTVLDETREANLREPIEAKCRVIEKCGQRADYEDVSLSPHDTERFVTLLLTPEEQLEDLAIKDWFSPAFTQTNFWYCWSTMLAFKDYHSLIEARRYFIRFIQHADGLTRLKGILHTEFNEYDSMIKPLQLWLAHLGVRFHLSTEVTDLSLETEAGGLRVTAIHLRDSGGEHDLVLGRHDLVFVTNGSLTENTSTGDKHTRLSLNRDTAHRGCFSLWEKLAAKSAKLGNPAKFISDIDKTNWISFFVTVRQDSRLFDHLERLTGNRAGTSGAITLKDSNWLLGIIPYAKYYPDQPDDVQVLWANGPFTDRPGNFIKKPMLDCTGAEMLTELLYHLGLGDQATSIVEHCHVSTALMPYITSQFMPRKISDRPLVIPQGSLNLAFIGQFAEIPQDVVFTVETSVRTAMIAAYGLLGLDKPLTPVYECQYDLRVILALVKSVSGLKELAIDKLPPALLGALSPQRVIELLNRVPPYDP